MQWWQHLTVLTSTQAAALERVAVWLDGGSQCLNVDTQDFLHIKRKACRLLFRALSDRGSLLLVKTALTMVFCMSGSLPDISHDKEKLHLSIQARQDQIHPSEDLSVLALPARSDLDSTDGDTDADISKPAAKSLLPNGEVHLGSRKERGADGSWKYTWPDGFIFEGEVSDKMESGKGKFTWPSGAMYEGSFLNGCFHGFGTYTHEDGTVYAGNWIMNLKHGYGEKCYATGDDYKGYWSQGKREGIGTYTWKNGNFYSGNWKGDVMCGRGKLTWRNGDTFEGQWADGKVHGRGVYRWVESGCYVGTWSRGLKDGKGTFYPPGTEPPKYRLLLHGSSIGSDVEEESGNRRRSFGLWRTSSRDPGKMVQHNLHRERQVTASTSSTTNFLRKAESLPTRAVSLERKWSLESAFEKLTGLEVGSTSSIAGEPILEDDEFKMEETVLPIVEREYAQGVLINEIVKERFPSKRARRRQKRQSKEIKRPGETIIKGHRSYDLMLNLQLGIRYSVGKTSGPQRDLIPSDFGHRARIWMRFPREGSQLTPPHPSVDFRWKDYCPMVFRKLREMFKIDAADYMMSLCGNAALRELSSPGKSGSIFFLSHDDRYLIKTLRKQELKVLLKMLRNYYNHVCKYENTLITKFFGLHRIKLAGGHKVRFVVMGNVFCTELAVHRRYDLKGSSLGRSTDKIEIDETTTLKDLDLDFTFHLEPTWRESLLQQIEDDCSFLESQQIMDYSLLLGLHRRAPQYAKLHAQQSIIEGDMTATIDDDEAGAYPEGLVLVTHEPNDRTSGSHIRGSSLRAAVAGDEQVDLLLAGTARLRIQLGVNMPARADRRPDVADLESVMETEDVVLCLGIIDILQEYNMVKRIEHAYKSLQFDSVSISAVDPHLYSQRFQDCLRKVFPEPSY